MKATELRRLAFLAVLTLVLVAGAGAAAQPASADSNGESETQVYTDSSDVPYGQGVYLNAFVYDRSTSCIAFFFPPFDGCDRPQGRVDFYAVVGSDQQLLAQLPLTVPELSSIIVPDNAETFDPASDQEFGSGYCCLDPGTYTIRGYYVPGTFDASSDDAGPVTVTKADPAPTFTQSSTTTSFGQDVTFTIHVQGSNDPNALKPTGSVSVSETTPDGVTTFGTAPLAGGDATITTSQLSAGTRNLHVHYSGDSRYNDRNSDVLVHVVDGASTESGLSASTTQTTFAQPVTLTANVATRSPAVGTASGSVSFYDGGVSGTLLGTTSLNGSSPDVATLTTSALAVGTHTLQAAYTGSPNFNGSTTNSVTVTVTKAGTSTSLSSTVNPSLFGQAVTFTAAVSGPGTSTPTGTVQFKDGTALLGSAQPVTAGAAELTIQSLTGGSHSITAVYSGSVSYDGSTSGALAQSVTCDRVISGSVSSVSASSGTTCLSSAKVSGGLFVAPGAKVSLVNTTIGGTLTVSGAGALTVCGATVGGNVTISGATGLVVLGDVPGRGCSGNTFRGSVTLSSNRGGIVLGDDRITGGVTVSGNTGPQVSANRISGDLACSGNSPPATNGGRPNTVSGTRRGECGAAGF